jgi:hypothetical protein
MLFGFGLHTLMMSSGVSTGALYTGSQDTSGALGVLRHVRLM